VVEVGWASAADRIKGQQYPLTYWQPVEHIAKNWCAVMKLAQFAQFDHLPGGGVENYAIGE